MAATSLSKSELVDKVLALTGAPRGKGEIARRNLDRKSPDELAGLYVRLNAAAQRGGLLLKPTQATHEKLAEAAALRQDALERLRAIPLRLPQISTSTSAKSELEAGRTHAYTHVNYIAAAAMHAPADTNELSELFEKLMLIWMSEPRKAVTEVLTSKLFDLVSDREIGPQFELYCRHLLDNAGRSSLRLLRNEIFHSHLDMDHLLYSLLDPSDPVVANAALEPVVLPSPDGRLNPAQAVDGLVKIRHYAQTYDTDLVVYIDHGGETVGTHLAAQIKARTGKSVRLMDVNKFRPAKAQRVLLLADVVRDLDLLHGFKRKILGLATGIEVRLAAIAGSFFEHERLGGDDAVYFTHITLHGPAELPWDRSGGYRETKQGFTFGAGSREALPVNRKFLDRLADDIEASEAANQ